MLKPIEVPAGVEVTVGPQILKLKGPLGEVEGQVPPELELQYDESEKTLRLTRRANDRHSRSLHGTYRSMLANLVEGVTKGFEKRMEIHGTGYSVEVRGDKLVLQIGFCHEVVFEVPKSVTVEVGQKSAQPDNPARFVLRGTGKQELGQFAADVRAARPPEPYKGKGIRCEGEYVLRKEGKTFGGLQ